MKFDALVLGQVGQDFVDRTGVPRPNGFGHGIRIELPGQGCYQGQRGIVSSAKGLKRDRQLAYRSPSVSRHLRILFRVPMANANSLRE